MNPVIDDKLFDRITNLTSVEMEIPHEVAKIWVIAMTGVTVDHLIVMGKKDLRHMTLVASTASMIGQLSKILKYTDTKSLAISAFVRKALDDELDRSLDKAMQQARASKS